jgi:A/G-specific adenine glycosylase
VRNAPRRTSQRSGRLDPALSPALLRWFRRTARPLPWRRNRSLYRIWLAEVLLQQTRVAQARPYFEKLVRRFPDLTSLSSATEQEVLKLWEGAGYYARARHLHQTARILVRDRAGRWPKSSAELATLPGIGPYIAAAVASLAFGEPILALEANGLRVGARWSLESGDIRAPNVRGRIVRTLDRLLPQGHAGAFNEALMELGETICLVRQPLCDRCPVARFCRARQELPDPGVLPFRRGRPAKPSVVASVVAVRRAGRWLVRRRPPTGLLGGLWELPGGKCRPGESPVEAARRELREETGLQLGRLTFVGTVRHEYSHFRLTLHVFSASLQSRDARRRRVREDERWVTPSEFESLPRPRATLKAMALVAGLGGDRAG